MRFEYAVVEVAALVKRRGAQLRKEFKSDAPRGITMGAELAQLQVACAAVGEHRVQQGVDLQRRGVRVHGCAVVARTVEVVSFSLEPRRVRVLNVEGVELLENILSHDVIEMGQQFGIKAIAHMIEQDAPAVGAQFFE